MQGSVLIAFLPKSYLIFINYMREQFFFLFVEIRKLDPFYGT